MNSNARQEVLRPYVPRSKTMRHIYKSEPVFYSLCLIATLRTGGAVLQIKVQGDGRGREGVVKWILRSEQTEQIRKGKPLRQRLIFSLVPLMIEHRYTVSARCSRWPSVFILIITLKAITISKVEVEQLTCYWSVCGQMILYARS